MVECAQITTRKTEEREGQTFMEINNKLKGKETEEYVVALINDYLKGAKFEPMWNSGAGLPGDIMWTKETPLWAKEWLKEHQGEIKGEAKPRLHAYVGQCQSQFNSVQGWVVYYKCPVEWNIPGNVLVIQPITQFLMEQRLLLDNNAKEDKDG